MALWRTLRTVGLVASLWPVQQAHGLDVNVNDRTSLVNAASVSKQNLLVYYKGYEPGQIPGMCTDNYYWWLCGAMMGQLIQHWQITGDDSSNEIVSQALQFQVGDNRDYNPTNWSKQLGNDDQAYWAFSVLDAAELKFPDPPESTNLSWLGLAQAVFNAQTTRWDTIVCGGGLRWQIFRLNTGYDYKNVMTNGGFFQIAARLARFTGNTTYVDWAEKTWDWLASTPLIEQHTATKWDVWDGGHEDKNCTDPVKTYFSYNPGTLLMGAAYLYNFTEEQKWRDRINILLDAMDIYYVKSAGANTADKQPELGGNIMCELATEMQTPQGENRDAPAFKGFTTRWLTITSQLAPWTRDKIVPLLRASANGAAAQCVGAGRGDMKTGTACGRRWYQSRWDGQFGLGEQLSAMSIFQNNIVLNGGVPPPVTLRSGGTSKSDPGAGLNDPNPDPRLTDPLLRREMTTADKAGAGILTFICAVLAMAAAFFMIT